MRTFCLFVQVIITACMIGVILLQRGEETGTTSPLGVIRGRGNPLTRITAFLAGAFLMMNLLLAILARREVNENLFEKTSVLNASLPISIQASKAAQISEQKQHTASINHAQDAASTSAVGRASGPNPSAKTAPAQRSLDVKTNKDTQTAETKKKKEQPQKKQDKQNHG